LINDPLEAKLINLALTAKNLEASRPDYAGMGEEASAFFAG
jgi:hypothetical protein